MPFLLTPENSLSCWAGRFQDTPGSHTWLHISIIWGSFNIFMSRHLSHQLGQNLWEWDSGIIFFQLLIVQLKISWYYDSSEPCFFPFLLKTDTACEISLSDPRSSHGWPKIAMVFTASNLKWGLLGQEGDRSFFEICLMDPAWVTYSFCC